MIFEKANNQSNNTIFLQSYFDSTEPPSIQSQLYLFNNVQSLDLEQHCLIRLKKQREKIEQMADIINNLQKELCQSREQKKQLQIKIDELQQCESYRQVYQNLKLQFQNMLRSHQFAEFEIEELKIQLQNTITSSQQQIDQLKVMLKREKETNAINITHLQSILSDKDEEIRKLQRCGKSNEADLRIKISQLLLENNNLREHLKSQGTQLQQNEQLLKKQIKVKEMDMVEYEKIIDKFKKQINIYKLQLSNTKYDFEKDRDQYLEAIEQNRTTLKLIKKQKQAKENENAQLKQDIKRYEQKNKSLMLNVQHLKANQKKIKIQFESNKIKNSQIDQKQRRKMQNLIIRLKKQIQKHVEQYNLITIELKRVKQILQQKQHNEKQRKLLLMGEYRQMDKIQKEVNRLR